MLYDLLCIKSFGKLPNQHPPCEYFNLITKLILFACFLSNPRKKKPGQLNNTFYETAYSSFVLLNYTLHLKKVTFNLSICPGAHGSLTLTDGVGHLQDSSQVRYPLSTQQIEKCILSFGVECVTFNY